MTLFLVDQQLRQALATYLAERGCDTRHVKRYPGRDHDGIQTLRVWGDSEDGCRYRATGSAIIGLVVLQSSV